MPPRTAAETALSCASDRDLRVPCYCEENVWRLAHRRLRGGGGGVVDDNDDDVDAGDRDGNEDGRVREAMDGDRYYVAFVSNPDRCCPMFRQLAAGVGGPVFLDYHVVLIRAVGAAVNSPPTEAVEVLDVDTRLPYPCPLSTYLSESFPHVTRERDADAVNEDDALALSEEARERYAPLFRVVEAEIFLEDFYSDRMHMYDDAKKRWISDPPHYERIMDGWRGGDDGGGGRRRPGDGGDADDDDDRKSNLDKYISMAGSGGKGGGGRR